MLIEVPIAGRCMEKVGIMDGDHVVIDTNIFPSRDDVCWCTIDGRNMIKAYDAESHSLHFVSTRYVDGWDGKPFQQGFFLLRKDIRGTVVQITAADGTIKWVREAAPDVPPIHMRWVEAKTVIPLSV